MLHTILGQLRALDVLQSVLQSGRLHHAYIFHGPMGVGKLTTACRFASVLLCHEPQTDLKGRVGACGDCPSCRLLSQPTDHAATPGGLAHPDFHVVTKEQARYSEDSSVRGRKLTTIPVTVLRKRLIEPVYRSAQLGSKKVLILDEANLLNDTGQNLLLKTLEEPPPGTYLILVTDSQEKLLATIRSRCQHVGFVPLPNDVVGHWLDQHAPDLTGARRDWLIAFVSGSLGRTQLAIDYGLSDWAQVVVPALDQMSRGEFPLDLGQQMAQMIDTFSKQWVDRHEGASKEAANRQGAKLLWSMIGQFAQQKLFDTSAQCQSNDPEALEQALAPWLGAIDVLSIVEGELAANVNMGLVTDHLVSLLYRSLSSSGLAIASSCSK